MFRQFDVIVVGNKYKDNASIEPPFSDPALGWFFTNDINDALSKTEAEWIVLARDSVKVTRDFLNNLAECNSAFPMVDAFAPRIRCASGHFKSARILCKKNGFSEIAEDSSLRYVAAPHPDIAAFSRRIVQRTGKVDTSFPHQLQLADYSLRMLHAGGRLFSVPYLVIDESAEFTDNTLSKKDFENNCAKILYKGLGLIEALKYGIHHLHTLLPLFKERKTLTTKRSAAISLSKMTPEMFQSIH